MSINPDNMHPRRATSRLFAVVVIAAVSLVFVLGLYLVQTGLFDHAGGSGSAISSRTNSNNLIGQLSSLFVERISIETGNNRSSPLSGFIYVASTAAEQQEGFMNASSFGNCNGFSTNYSMPCLGMIFFFAQTGNQCFWMHDTIMALQQVWISANGTVTNIYFAQPNSDTTVCYGGKYVLETNQSEPISLGDLVSLSPA